MVTIAASFFRGQLHQQGENILKNIHTYLSGAKSGKVLKGNASPNSPDLFQR